MSHEDTSLLIERNDAREDEHHHSKGKFEMLSLTGTFLFVVLLFIWGPLCVLSFIYTNENWGKYNTRDWVCMFFTFSPLIALEFLLGIERVKDDLKQFFRQFRLPTLPVSLFLTLFYIISCVFYVQFPLLGVTVVFSIAICSITTNYMVQKYQMSRRDSFLVHGLIVLMLAPMLDFRWFESIYVGPGGMGYDWWALFITILGALGWSHYDNLTNFNYRFWPLSIKELCVALVGPLPLIILIVPIGLLSGFLHWPPSRTPVFWEIPAFYIENFTTVAITEELFFRAIIMNTVDELIPSRRGWLGVIIANVLFGIWHFPRRASIGDQALYGTFAFIAGCLYSIVYTLGNNNLFSSSITHSIVDTVWAFWFS
eukprot:TRINITY_DN3631_c0_g2_i1.p1 TRINITY_DN3631_c0_g2~~TRINITY_DN3631_c0_g2_i1.p1  ORF type:complete len:369 (-),score=34.68 TRINITY_DN3631_c0_g2_i1:63-1169(-)